MTDSKIEKRAVLRFKDGKARAKVEFEVGRREVLLAVAEIITSGNKPTRGSVMREIVATYSRLTPPAPHDLDTYLTESMVLAEYLFPEIVEKAGG